MSSMMSFVFSLARWILWEIVANTLVQIVSTCSKYHSLEMFLVLAYVVYRRSLADWYRQQRLLMPCVVKLVAFCDNLFEREVPK